jgi:SP family sugar:H+ symporter-like MFS transporter
MEVEAEVNEIITNLELEMKLGMRSYLDCFKSTKDKMALRTLTGIFVQTFQQLTGSSCFHSVF